MAAPRKGKQEPLLSTSLGAIAEAIARASGDPIVGSMSAGQALFLIANIIRLEAARVKGKE